MQHVSTIEELQEAARTFGASLVPNTKSATLVTLSGELGAGKTAFVQECARTLGVVEDVTSPTFVIENRYELPQGGAYTHLIHIDAYRLESADALEPLRFTEDLANPGALIMLEWPERVEEALLSISATVTIQLLPDGARQIAITHLST